jgi:glycosyltransferase involved in cell wall biosynthesis
VDNGSDDGTFEMARVHADIAIQAGNERSAQRNHGARLSHGEYLLFMDSDMSLHPDVVSQCLRALQPARASAVVIPEISVGTGFWAHCRALERSCYVGDELVEAPRFFTRQAFESVGGFDEGLVAFEDWDLSMRVADGSPFPRANAWIVHDEGKLRLRACLAKKRYYAGSLLVFWRKHGIQGVRRANSIARPAFARNWRKLLRHPLLSAGMIVLKSLEVGAALTGLVGSLLHGGVGSPRSLPLNEHRVSNTKL